MFCRNSIYGTSRPEKAKRLPRSHAPAVLSENFLPFLWSALLCGCPVSCCAASGTPKQRQKPSTKYAVACERGKCRMFSSRVCRYEKYAFVLYPRNMGILRGVPLTLLRTLCVQSAPPEAQTVWQTDDSNPLPRSGTAKFKQSDKHQFTVQNKFFLGR